MDRRREDGAGFKHLAYHLPFSEPSFHRASHRGRSESPCPGAVAPRARRPGGTDATAVAVAWRDSLG